MLSLKYVLDPIKAEILNEPHLWQCGSDVHREARQGTHNDGDKPVHLHLEDSVILDVVLERPVMVTGDEQKRQGGSQRDLAIVLLGVIPELLQ